jgi:hypothetical protein
MAPKKTVSGQNREKIRESFWPGAQDGYFWRSAAEPGGFFVVPACSHLIFQILSDKDVAGDLHCGEVYLELAHVSIAHLKEVHQETHPAAKREDTAGG